MRGEYGKWSSRHEKFERGFITVTIYVVFLTYIVMFGLEVLS